MRAWRRGATVELMIHGEAELLDGIGSPFRPAEPVARNRKSLEDYEGGAVALVTAIGSHGAEDFRQKFEERKAGFQRDSGSDERFADLIVEDVKLLDADDVARGIRAAGARPGVGLVAVVRGGGSPEEFRPFDAPGVVTALADVAERMPVVTGLGHSRDHHRADDVVSCHARTPLEAAEIVAGTVWSARQRRDNGLRGVLLLAVVLASLFGVMISTCNERASSPSSGAGSAVSTQQKSASPSSGKSGVRPEKRF